MSDPLVVATRADLDRALDRLRTPGARLALVPTMGALHDGHRALMRRAHEVADVVVVSIFVNPLQFGSADDLARYPRTWDPDLAVCRAESVTVVWAPSVAEMYPHDVPTVSVSAGGLGEQLEGASRPGHFDGMLTVVAKLFGQVRPDAAVFGAKDAQQLFLVRRMSGDLDLRVAVEPVETVRADDGLALSSRNGRLSDEGRRAATALPRALAAGASVPATGPTAVRAAALTVLDAEPGVMLDYLALVDPDTFAEVDDTHAGPTLVLVAGLVEGTRLIDNAMVSCG